MLDDFLAKYDPTDVLSIDKIALNPEETEFRWHVSVNDEDAPADVDIRIRQEGDENVLLLVVGSEEIELDRWNPTIAHAVIREPGRVVRTLGDLKQARDRETGGA